MSHKLGTEGLRQLYTALAVLSIPIGALVVSTASNSSEVFWGLSLGVFLLAGSGPYLLKDGFRLFVAGEILGIGLSIIAVVLAQDVLDVLLPAGLVAFSISSLVREFRRRRAGVVTELPVPARPEGHGFKERFIGGFKPLGTEIWVIYAAPFVFLAWVGVLVAYIVTDSRGLIYPVFYGFGLACGAIGLAVGTHMNRRQLKQAGKESESGP